MEEVTIWKIVATFDLLKYICNVVTEVVLLLVDNGADHNFKNHNTIH